MNFFTIEQASELLSITTEEFAKELQGLDLPYRKEGRYSFVSFDSIVKISISLGISFTIPESVRISMQYLDSIKESKPSLNAYIEVSKMSPPEKSTYSLSKESSHGKNRELLAS